MNARPTVDVCENCGAPLDLDESGRCRWCHAHVRIEPPPSRRAVYVDDLASLVPDGLDDCSTSAPFIFLMLTALDAAGKIDPAIPEFVLREPGLAQGIRALSTAVSAAGVRVRDARLLKNSFDENLRVYTPEEIWIFDLAVDVIAMLGTLPGLRGSTRAQIADNLGSLDRNVRGHTWRKELKRAAAGPGEFRELRARVPRHETHPTRAAGGGESVAWM